MTLVVFAEMPTLDFLELLRINPRDVLIVDHDDVIQIGMGTGRGEIGRAGKYRGAIPDDEFLVEDAGVVVRLDIDVGAQNGIEDRPVGFMSSEWFPKDPSWPSWIVGSPAQPPT